MLHFELRAQHLAAGEGRLVERFGLLRHGGTALTTRRVRVPRLMSPSSSTACHLRRLTDRHEQA